MLSPHIFLRASSPWTASLPMRSIISSSVTYPLWSLSRRSKASLRFRSSTSHWDKPAAINSCHRIVVSVFLTRMALKMSSTSSSIRAPSEPAPAFVTSTCLSDSREISPDPSVSRVSNSLRRSLICSGRRVKLRTSQRSFLMSENSLKLTRARTTFGFKVWSLSVLVLCAHSFNQGRICAVLAVGRSLGSVTNRALIKSLALSLTRSQISKGSNS
mmetsp:Transcript_23961/g.52415  ORF Transcript_23961/g.52415 Transcript_23961/m.52415 type:complete len:215 (+) Transcript_23961:1482-2126(+)